MFGHSFAEMQAVLDTVRRLPGADRFIPKWLQRMDPAAFIDSMTEEQICVLARNIIMRLEWIVGDGQTVQEAANTDTDADPK